MHDLVRMRFPQQALEELRQIDPNTPVSLSFIRRLVRTGAIPSVPVGAGKRRLLISKIRLRTRRRRRAGFVRWTSGGGGDGWRKTSSLSPKTFIVTSVCPRVLFCFTV